MYTIGQLKKQIENVDNDVEVVIQPIYNPEYESVSEDIDVVGSVHFKTNNVTDVFGLVVRGTKKETYDDNLVVKITPRFTTVAKTKKLPMAKRILGFICFWKRRVS